MRPWHSFQFSLDQGQIRGKLILIVRTQGQLLWYFKTFNFIIHRFPLVKKELDKLVAKGLIIP